MYVLLLLFIPNVYDEILLLRAYRQLVRAFRYIRIFLNLIVN